MVSYDDAKTICSKYDQSCHMINDEEWSTLAIWAMTRGVKVYGNNSSCKDFSDRLIVFTSDPTRTTRALTGSGRNANWLEPINLTTHTGKTDGVYDLNGNVAEWTSDLGTSTNYRFSINGNDTGASMPNSGPITSLITDKKLRRYGLPSTTGLSGLEIFSLDEFTRPSSGLSSNSSLEFSIRGGHLADGVRAGMWRIQHLIKDGHNYHGFRPVLKF